VNRRGGITEKKKNEKRPGRESPERLSAKSPKNKGKKKKGGNDKPEKRTNCWYKKKKKVQKKDWESDSSDEGDHKTRKILGSEKKKLRKQRKRAPGLLKVDATNLKKRGNGFLKATTYYERIRRGDGVGKIKTGWKTPAKERKKKRRPKTDLVEQASVGSKGEKKGGGNVKKKRGYETEKKNVVEGKKTTIRPDSAAGAKKIGAQKIREAETSKETKERKGPRKINATARKREKRTGR